MQSVAHQEPAELRAGLYLRVSDPKQERDGTSLDTQEAAGRRHAAERLYALLEEHVYREIHTGVELWERKQLQRLREAIRRREIDVLIVYAIDRLSRDPVHLGVLISEAEHAGVAVEFVTEPLDNTPEGQLIRFVRGYAAKVEHEKIRERTVRGIRARAESGKLLPGGRPLYGYRWRDETKSAYEIDPATAPVVRRIFDEALRGETLRSIAARLTAEGVPTCTGLSHWVGSSVRQTLTSPRYTGSAVAFSIAKVKRNGKISKRRRPEGEQIPLPAGTIPPLIHRETFDAVQARLRLNQRCAARNNRDPEAALLRGGYVRCGYCDRAMVFRGDCAVYACNSNGNTPGFCPSRIRIKAATLDEAVWAHIEETVTRPETIAAELARLQTADPTDDDLAAVERRLGTIARQQRNLIEQLANLGASVATLVNEKLTMLAQQQEQLVAERDAILERRQNWQAALARLDHVQAWCSTVAANVAELSYQQKRMLLDALGLEVKVWRMDHDPRWEINAEIPIETTVVNRTATRSLIRS